MNRKLIFRNIVLITLMAMAVSAQDFDGLKIYINPGHGGHNPSNDRYIPQTGFWESEGNLTKGLHLRTLLKNANARVYMSRTQNREQDDLPLSQIDADANANDVDYFHAIHSNGFQGNSNYTLMLYKEDSGQPVDPLSKTMCDMMGPEIRRANRTTTSYTRGDYSFLGFNLGVLNYLNYGSMHGTLSEGSFHDYIPESWRLMSLAYRRHEAIAILRSLIAFYNLDPIPHGVIAGIVRDKSKTVDYDFSYISALPNDRKKAVNKAIVTLLPGHRVFFVDNNNNGFFMFDSVAAGDYQLIIEGPEYSPDTLNISVKANETSFRDAFLTEDPTLPPRIVTTVPYDSNENTSTYSNIDITFSRAMNQQSAEQAFSITPPREGTFSWINDERTMRFRPEDAYDPATRVTVTVTKDARSVTGIPLSDDYTFSFTTAGQHVYPQVVEVFPASASDSIFIFTEISILFDQEMRRTDTQAAFSLEPPVDGSFTWKNSGRMMCFTPDQPLQPGKEYLVQLSVQAKNYYGVAIQSPLQFRFRTRRVNNLLYARQFPADGQVGVSPEMWFYFFYNHTLDLNSVSADRYRLWSPYGELQPIDRFRVTRSDGTTMIIFKPAQSLATNLDYTLDILPGTRDIEGFRQQDTLSLRFKTEIDRYESGQIIDDFESISSWQRPTENDKTVGVKETATRLNRNTTYELNGSAAGKLSYTFTEDSGGVCRLYNLNLPSLGSGSETEFGVWVYGDMSNNFFELWFDFDDTLDFAGLVDTLNWYGYKLVRFPLKNLNAAGEIKLNSIVVRQSAGGEKSGVIYLDDAQYDVTVGLERRYRAYHGVRQYALSQNYPNPFNPSTQITFTIPNAEFVTLKIYNLLGQEVATLVSGDLSAGRYRITWDGSEQASGVYLYKLQAGDFIRTRKMVLLR